LGNGCSRGKLQSARCLLYDREERALFLTKLESSVWRWMLGKKSITGEEKKPIGEKGASS